MVKGEKGKNWPHGSAERNCMSISRLLRKIKRKIRRRGRQYEPFTGSAEYWEERYAGGGHSGRGSYGESAEFKAEVLNNFVTEHDVASVIEFGCGDGNQLSLSEYQSYLGLDVSKTAISLCKKRFASDKSKTFKLIQEYQNEKADLALSLDVILHLVEDDAFESYMNTLFEAATRYVIIYSSNSDIYWENQAPHVRHRQFTPWVEENSKHWKLIGHIKNRSRYKVETKKESMADFYIYGRVGVAH